MTQVTASNKMSSVFEDSSIKRNNDFQYNSGYKEWKPGRAPASFLDYSNKASHAKDSLGLNFHSSPVPHSPQEPARCSPHQEHRQAMEGTIRNKSPDTKLLKPLPGVKMKGMRAKIFKKDSTSRQSPDKISKSHTFPPLRKQQDGRVVMSFTPRYQDIDEGREHSAPATKRDKTPSAEYSKELLKNALTTLRKFEEQLETRLSTELSRDGSEGSSGSRSKKVVTIHARKRKKFQKIAHPKTELESIAEAERENTFIPAGPESHMDEDQAIQESSDSWDSGHNSTEMDAHPGGAEYFSAPVQGSSPHSLPLLAADRLPAQSSSPHFLPLIATHRPPQNVRHVWALPRLGGKPVDVEEFGILGRDKLKQHIRNFAERRQKLHLPRLPLKQYG